MPITLQNEFGFSKTFSNIGVKYKTNSIISLSYIKYRFYSLIGLNYIMHLNITLHILLHPLNMHAQSHQDQKPLYGTSPVRNIQITHNNQTIEAAPYKFCIDDTLSNTKHIINQNNFTNTNLNTLGKQLTRLEKQIQRTTTSSVDIKTSTDLKLKNPVFKPYQITKTSQT